MKREDYKRTRTRDNQSQRKQREGGKGLDSIDLHVDLRRDRKVEDFNTKKNMGERGREIKGARRKKRESIQRQENTSSSSR